MPLFIIHMTQRNLNCQGCALMTLECWFSASLSVFEKMAFDSESVSHLYMGRAVMGTE